MKKFTKSLLTLVLLVLAVGSVKAEGKYEYTSYPLSTLISENTLVSMVAGEEMVCGDNSNNQMFLKEIETTLPDFPDAGSYRFRVSVANDGTLPDGVSTLYRIRPYKSDGTTIYTGPWGNDGYLCDLSWTYNVQSTEGGSYFAISAVDGKENTYKISSYKQDGTLVKENIFSKSEWIFCTISKKSSSDPLQDEKDALQDAIDFANKHDSYAQTAASWKTLTDAVSAGEAELVNESTTAELLTAATKAITDAIDGLELQEGYTNLTKDMMFSWTGWGAEAVKGSVFNDCAYVLFKSTNQPYGDPSVNAWADLSGYEKLVVVATGTPRFLLNRDADNGQWNADESQSHLIDNTVGDGESWHAQYFSQEGNLYTVDLAKLTKNKGFAYLNAIKAKSNITVSGMYLYRAPDPLQPEKDALQAAIDLGKAKNTFAKTTASVTALSDAIDAGTAELANDGATAESLTAATTAINNAIAGLKLQDGYTNLTSDMYYEWDSNTTPTIGNFIGCNVVLNESTGQPYGDSQVYYTKFADISDFSAMHILATEGTPRIMMNRQVPIDPSEQGYDPNGGAYVQITDAPVEGKVTVDLTAYDYAHLNAIKGANWQNVTVTEMLLYRTVTVGATGYATFGSLYKNAKVNGVKAYAAIYNKETGKVALTEVTNVPAGVGVVIEGEAGEYAPTFDVAPADIASDLKVSNGTVTGDGSTIYVLNKKNEKVGFYLLKAGEKLEAGKAYLEITGSSEARGFIGFEGATGINEVNVNKAAVKTGKIYNLNGQIVSKPSKGLFIVDGKVVSF